MGTLLLMNLVVIVNVLLITSFFFNFTKLSDYLTTLFLLYVAQIVFSLQLLGIFKQLYLPQVLALNLLFLCIGIFFVSTFGRKMKRQDYKDYLTDISHFFLMNKVELLCFSSIAGFFIVKIVINLMNPPFGWDSLNYHFPFPVEWLKHGNLENPISISGDPSVSYYPINGSLFFLWFILPLKNVFLADLGQAPFFIAVFLAVFSIARKFGLDKEYAFFSASLFSFMPNYFKQLKIAYVDVIVASLFLMTFNFLIIAFRERSLKKLLLASISLGLMLGTKTTAMPLTLLLLLLLLAVAFYSFPRRIFYALGLVFGAIAVFGSFSFIRNILQTGNPLYPLNFKIFDFVVFKGVIDNSMYRTGIRPGDFSLAKILFSEGLGVQTVLLALPAVLSAPLFLFKQKKSADLVFGYFLILPALLILVFRFILPLPNIRYIYALFAIGLIIAFYLLDILKAPKALTRWLVVICILASAAENGKRIELVVSFVMTALVFILLPFFLRVIKKWFVIILLSVFLIVTFPALLLLEKDYVANEYPRYISMVKYSGFWPDATKAWVWLDNNTDKNNIAYIGRPVSLPLYGRNFKNNVYYVSVNKVEPAMLHYFPNSRYIWGYNGNETFRNFESPENYRGNADYNVWLANLKNKKIDFLFIYSELIKKTDDFPIEDKWAISHPEIFNLVFENSTIRIYKLKFNKE